ncbi:prepilin-type N-terminal cleavage/methylation domain-containing protein [Vibrio crassostreae]|uniref:prepilin-type N-terminal cleavage/methylation domain-containing protein n=1 Tax=Vibrio crassostreae TaxID=246167 RepID=UPI001B300321|nr:prepilin-type N-terminal cleavage/methylation domain-containing protein [Vibrio crassostreae]
MRKRKGFTLIEVILASALLATTTIYRMQTEVEIQKLQTAQSYAHDLASVMHAIDKRIFLDGVKKSSGSWNSTWSTTELVANDMIGRELIAKNNSVCGDPSGWSPVIASNSSEALVNCGLFQGRVPFNMHLEGERKGTVNDNAIINSWSLRAYHTSPEEFEKHFYLYPEIIKQVKRKSPLQMTGSLKVRYVNRVTDDELSAPDCYKKGTECAIEMLYSTSSSSIMGEDVYLRVDGSNAMRNSLFFATNANNPVKCWTQTSPTATPTQVNCGLNFDPSTQELDVVAKELFSQGLKLVDTNNATPAIVTCKDESGANEYCGVTLVESGGSVKAKAYLNSMIANESMQLRNNSGSLVFDVDSSGNLYAKGTIDTDGHITTKGNLTADGNILTKGNLTAHGQLIANSGAISNGLTTGGTATIGGQLNVAKQSTFSDVVRANKALYVNENVIGYSDVLSTGGDIAAINGNVIANQKITANYGDIVASRGNLITTQGNITATNGTVNAKSVNAQTLQVNAIKTETDRCDTKGQLARDSTGATLSCVDGKWAASGGMQTLSQSPNTSGTHYHPTGYKVVSVDGESGNLGTYSLVSGKTYHVPQYKSVSVSQACTHAGTSCPTSVSASCNIKISGSSVSGCTGTTKYNKCYFTGSSCSSYSQGSVSITAKITDLLYMK